MPHHRRVARQLNKREPKPPVPEPIDSSVDALDECLEAALLNARVDGEVTGTGFDITGQYLREATQTPLLTREAELHLARALEAGQRAARHLQRNDHNIRSKRSNGSARLTSASRHASDW
jgi:sigma-70-like protein